MGWWWLRVLIDHSFIPYQSPGRKSSQIKQPSWQCWSATSVCASRARAKKLFQLLWVAARAGWPIPQTQGKQGKTGTYIYIHIHIHNNPTIAWELTWNQKHIKNNCYGSLSWTFFIFGDLVELVQCNKVLPSSGGQAIKSWTSWCWQPGTPTCQANGGEVPKMKRTNGLHLKLSYIHLNPTNICEHWFSILVHLDLYWWIEDNPRIPSS